VLGVQTFSRRNPIEDEDNDEYEDDFLQQRRLGFSPTQLRFDNAFNWLCKS